MEFGWLTFGCFPAAAERDAASSRAASAPEPWPRSGYLASNTHAGLIPPGFGVWYSELDQG